MSEAPNYADQGRQINELAAERDQLLKELLKPHPKPYDAYFQSR